MGFFWNIRNKKKPNLESSFKGNEFHLKTLTALDAEWIKIDDMIKLLKEYQKHYPNDRIIHILIKEMVKLKHQK